MDLKGTFDFTLDAKNRLTVPSKFRPQFSDGVVLAPALEPCVGVWRPVDYDAWWRGLLAGHDELSPEYRQLHRHFTANAFDSELDGAGRVMVPAPLLRFAGLDRDVTVTGAGGCLEIWDRERWTAYNGEIIANPAAIAAGLRG